MKDTGEIVDPTSLFGGKSQVKDTQGHVVKSQVEQPAFGLESMAAAMPQVDLKAEELKQRAVEIDNSLNSYFDQQPVKELIEYTRSIVGADFQVSRPTSDSIRDLRRRLMPNFNSTSEIIKRRQSILTQERILRWKLRLMGPQFVEAATTWFDSLSGKKKAMLAPLAKLMGLTYDDAVKRRHLPMILKILAMKDIKDQLITLEENSNATPFARDGELIVTFIRFVRGQESWKAIKAEVAKSDKDLDKLKIEKFNVYEKEAVDRGPLNLMSIPTDPVGASLATGLMVATGTASLGSAAIWGSDKVWLQAQHLFATDTVQSMLHWVYLIGTTTGHH